VLRRLLRRQELQGEQLDEAVLYALQWLAKYPLGKDAAFVLPPLLARAGTQGGNLGVAIRGAFAWLKEHPLEKDAGFVLDALLGRAELQRKGLRVAVRDALAWLTQHPSEKVAGFVLSRLLCRSDLKGAEFDAVVERALDWLPGYLDTKAARFVLKHLMPRLLPPSPSRYERIRYLKHLAVEDLRHRVGDSEDQSVSSLLHSWLRCQVTHPDLDRDIIGLANEWLASDPKRGGAELVFNLVLRREDASDADWLLAARVALGWLSAQKRSLTGTDRTANALLMRPALLPYPSLQAAVSAAIQFLPSIRGRYERELLCQKLVRSVAHLPQENSLVGEVRDGLESVLRSP